MHRLLSFTALCLLCLSAHNGVAQTQSSLTDESDMITIEQVCPSIIAPEGLLTAQDIHRIAAYRALVERFRPQVVFEEDSCPSLTRVIAETVEKRDALTIWI